jgi:hypothetical protein
MNQKALKEMTDTLESIYGSQQTADTAQVGGDHYVRMTVQPWAAMQSWMSIEEFCGFLRGNVIKYIARDKVDRLEDYKKARHYLDKLIEMESQ